MTILRHIILLLILFISDNTVLQGQNGNKKFCINAEPLCGSTLFSYPNTSGRNFAEIGPEYGCLRAQKNPAWFYLQIANDGDIELKLAQSKVLGESPNLDVDFIVYGPFSDSVLPCTSDLIKANIIDCSYSLNFTELVNIPNTLAGEFYLLMITNHSELPGFITVTQTAGSATTNCVLVEDPVDIDQQGCQGTAEILDATTTGATHYQWYGDDGSGNFTFMMGQTSAFLNVNTAGTYKAEAISASGVIIEIYEFNIIFVETADVSNPIVSYTICDYYNANDGIAQFNLDAKTTQLLSGYDASNFEVTYYKSEEDAMSGTATPLPSLYTNERQTETLFVRIENISVSSPHCFTVGNFDIEVDLLPETTLNDSYILCINTNGTEEIQTPLVIDTHLSETEYTFLWRLNGLVLSSDTKSFILPVDEGDYEVEFTNRNTGCTNFAFTYVEVSEPPNVTAEVVTYAFIEENNIEVTATGIGIQDHEFSLDGGVWQNDSIFKNVTIGEHAITVRNTSRCGQTTITITVMDYPLYFTPNNDGIHDTWNIPGLKNQPQVKVYIYNRYGKLLKQLNPNSIGWDGTFNGLPMPTDDYWFTLEYMEPRDNTLKLFKAHFTLKR